jgi:hypothetical protein
MKRSTIAGGVFAIVLLLLVVAVGYRALKPKELAPMLNSTGDAAEADPSFLYGRITTRGGDTYEGRLRWGGDQEAFWADYFNGSKDKNPWATYAPLEQLRKPDSIKIFGVEFAKRERPIDLRRLFMSRFGDIARIEAQGRDVWVTLKSGAVFNLNRNSASDFDDGVRVWDDTQGVVDLDSLKIRTIEFLSMNRPGEAPHRLHGTVRTRHGDFTGFVQWNRKDGVGTDELNGRTSNGERRLRFDSIRSIARRSGDSSLVTQLDGSEIVFSGTPQVGDGNRGMYVDDGRYGRVLISWDAFERVDFRPGGNSPAYGEFPRGGPLKGTVITRAGSRLTGRLVYDLDESEVTETLDAPSHGVDYTIPFGLIASIVLPSSEERGAHRARIILQSGEELQLERAGDLGDGNAGILIFAEGRQQPDYVPWTDVKQVDLDRPAAMYPMFRTR